MIIVNTQRDIELSNSALPTVPRSSLIERPLSTANGYPSRFEVPSHQRLWERDYPNYAPPVYESPRLLEQDRSKNPTGWADPPDVTPEEFRLWKKSGLLQSYEGEIKLDGETGRPLNPLGRVGIQGRGALGKWGPNHAADAIVTRINKESGLLEILLIQRASGEWAIPGGMLDAGEDALTAARRELKEEAGISIDRVSAFPVYQGLGDGPRLTDNAWVETCAYHFHLIDNEEVTLSPKAGCDEMAAAWKVVSPECIASLYANHGELVSMMISQQRVHQPEWFLRVAEQLSDITHLPTLTDFASLKGRIGILGGSFDPIHQVHIEIAEQAKRVLALDAVVFIPAAQNPIKEHRPGALARERVDMTTLSLIDRQGLFISPIEVRREGVSFTIDTLQTVSEKITGAESMIFLLIGADCLARLSEWKDVKKIVELAQLVPIIRPGALEKMERSLEFEALSEFFGPEFCEQIRANFLPGIITPLSSTEVRQSIAKGEYPVPGVAPKVSSYIYERVLYQASVKNGTN